MPKRCDAGGAASNARRRSLGQISRGTSEPRRMAASDGMQPAMRVCCAKKTAERGRAGSTRLQRLRIRCQKRRLLAQEQASTMTNKRVKSKQSNVGAAAAPAQLYTSTCPWCQEGVESHIETGQVDHRHACGKKFRVQDGFLAGLTHPHTCPRCGTVIYSAKASGRIRSSHQKPNGRSCPNRNGTQVTRLYLFRSSHQSNLPKRSPLRMATAWRHLWGQTL